MRHLNSNRIFLPKGYDPDNILCVTLDLIIPFLRLFVKRKLFLISRLYPPIITENRRCGIVLSIELNASRARLLGKSSDYPFCNRGVSVKAAGRFSMITLQDICASLGERVENCSSDKGYEKFRKKLIGSNAYESGVSEDLHEFDEEV